MPLLDRPARDFFPIAGIGGNLRVQHYTALGTPDGDPVHFELERWRLRNFYRNRVRTHSGSNGATLRARVGGDWSIVVHTQAPATTFLDLLVGSGRSVGIILQLGDPVGQAAAGRPVLSYRAASALLELLDIVSDSQGDPGNAGSLVEGDIKLVSNSLLWGYVDGVQVSSALWP